MIPSDHFVRFYNEVFKFLDKKNGLEDLDELGAAVEEFKLKIKAMFDESTVLSRKVKEVALIQKQKERDFIQARRAIERIRMAI